MNIPVISGLISDLTGVIYEHCDSRYELSMVSKDWNIYCISRIKTIENNYKSIKQNCEERNILEIVRNYNKLDEKDVMQYACQYNVILLIKIIIRIGNQHYYWGLIGACRGGHIDLVKYMIKLGATDYNNGLNRACFGGYMDIVKYMIELGADDYSGGLFNACVGGDLDIVKYMIECGAKSYNYGLHGACFGKHINMVKYAIKLSANNGSYKARLGGFNDIVKYMIELGADSCGCGRPIQEHLDQK
jgi:hypothetical protein